MKSFLDKIKIIFHIFPRAIICRKNKKYQAPTLTFIAVVNMFGTVHIFNVMIPFKANVAIWLFDLH